MGLIKETSRKNLASKNILRQIWGAILHNWWLALLLLFLLILPIFEHISDIHFFGLSPNMIESWYWFLSITISVILLLSICYSILVSYKQRGELKGITICLLLNLVAVGVWMTATLYIFKINTPYYWLGCMTILLLLIVKTCNTLTTIFSVHKKEFAITWCQISILIAMGIWIMCFLLLFDTTDHPRLAAALGIAGTVLIWIFQDTVKGVVAFIHLRLNHLVCIDDWISVPKFGVDGMIKQVTLTTVTVENWDTTTSSIPTSALHADHFINYQNMVVGKTYGRQMIKSFIVDTSWFRPLSVEEITRIREKIKENETYELLINKDSISQNISDEEMQEGMLNAQLYRCYIFHWLMNHPHISQHPRLIVRWMEHIEHGMILQVNAFIIDSSLVAFERQQSQIVEHIIESLDWFGLRLYQSPSAYDVSNSNVHITDTPANYIKEMKND